MNDVDSFVKKNLRIFCFEKKRLSDWAIFFQVSQFECPHCEIKFLANFKYLYCLKFIVLFAKNCTNQIKSNDLNSHGEEAQEKPLRL